MANLTLAIDDDILRRARARAAERGTSVNAVIRDLLEQFAGPSVAAAAVRSMSTSPTVLARQWGRRAYLDAGRAP